MIHMSKSNRISDLKVRLAKYVSQSPQAYQKGIIPRSCRKYIATILIPFSSLMGDLNRARHRQRNSPFETIQPGWN